MLDCRLEGSLESSIGVLITESVEALVELNEYVAFSFVKACAEESLDFSPALVNI